MRDKESEIAAGLYRFYLPSLGGLGKGAVSVLDTAESHHVMHVLRLKTGSTVELFDGRGAWAPGQIESINKGLVRVSVGQSPICSPRPGPLIDLTFSVPKGKRLDWLLEKATELGAAALLPVICRRSMAGQEELSDNKRKRWLTHCIAAAKQSGTNYLPEIAPPSSLAAFLKCLAGAASPYQHMLVGMPGADGQGAATTGATASPVAATFSQRAGSGSDPTPGAPPRILIMVGPEGGFADDEVSDIKAAGLIPVSLGHTTLRIETAVVALLAATIAMFEQ
jgi:16S rRNA (uracil1498-N3)-methyltransferase